MTALPLWRESRLPRHDNILHASTQTVYLWYDFNPLLKELRVHESAVLIDTATISSSKISVLSVRDKTHD